MVRAMAVRLGGEKGRHRPCAAAIAAILGVALAAPLSAGCYPVPPGKAAVSDLAIEGASDINHEELEDRLATQESSRFLGLFSGVVYEYETFDKHALQSDLARIERYLRARGYYDARVQAARVDAVGKKVRVTIEVMQGDPVLVDSLTVHGDEAAEPDAREAIRDRIKAVLPLGSPLDEDKLIEAEKAALTALTTRGHAAAKVTRHAEVDLATHKARMSFQVYPGRVARYGPVTFEGLGSLEEDDVRRVFGVEEGQRYSSADLDESRQALLNLGVFASVDVIAGLEEAERSGIAPISVHCEPSKIRALLAGFGAEFDALKTDVHVIGGWQSANFLGGLRKLDIRAKPGIVLYPTRLPTVQEPRALLYEHRVNATMRQPAFLEKRLTGIAFAEYSIYPVILPVPTEAVLGYHELRGEVGVERVFGKLYVSPQYGYQANFPFDYLGRTGQVDRLQISYVELTTFLDFRDNPIRPRKGLYLGTGLQRAGGVLQGDADDLKMNPEVRGYVPLGKNVVLALRAATGFLFPFNYSEYAQINFRNPGPSRLQAASRDYQILFFRGFFGGGPTSNRGYPLRSIGPHDLIPYLSPAGQSPSAGGCNPTLDTNCVLPTGGLTLWEANVELRFKVAEALSLVSFCDSGDVSPFRVHYRFDRPHLSCGGGGRYDTPVGPIRLDVGARIPGMQYFDGGAFEGKPAELFGLPIAIAIAIGEAF